MAGSAVTNASNTELDHSTSIPSASGTPLTTIHELPGDECESESAVGFEDDERMRAMHTDDILITETAIVSAAAAAAAGLSASTTSIASAYARSKRLSLNMTLLSPSLHLPNSTVIPTPPSGFFTPPMSNTSSTVSSPGGSSSPSLNPHQWNSGLRQYIMTDIGPQPSNSQVPGLRNHPGLVRQRSYTKMGGMGFMTPVPSPSLSPSLSSSSVPGASFKGLGLGLSFPSSPSMPCLVE